MTITPTDEPIVEDEHEAAAGPKPPTDRRRRYGAMAVVAALVLLISIFLVEDPIAHEWYQVRQHHLTSTFAKARPVHDGDPVAVIQIPSQAINVTVVQGAGPGNLRSGPAHRASSPLPGSRGNSIIFGRSSGWGAPFDALSKLNVGDNIFVQPRTANGPGQAYFFRVTSTAVLPANDRVPYAASDDYRLTLVTASGGGRRVVTAISGSPGKLLAVSRTTTASTGPLAPSLTWPLVGLVGFAFGLGLLVLLQRRRRGSRSVLIVATPLALGFLLSLVLLGDTLFRSPIS